MSVRRVPIPEELVTQLEEAGEKANMGYATVAEAVKDAIRTRIDQLNAHHFNQKHKSEKEASPAEDVEIGTSHTKALSEA